MKIKKGDNIMVVYGKDRGKNGRVINVLPKIGKVIVENLNLKKKHRRPRKQGEKGQVVNFASPLDVSNVMVVCKSCGKKTRLGHKILEDAKKIRVCKKCGEEV